MLEHLVPYRPGNHLRDVKALTQAMKQTSAYSSHSDFEKTPY